MISSSRRAPRYRLVTGVVSNCVIRGGTAVANANAAGAGVELAGAGTLTHCVVSNNVVQGTSSDGSMTGGAIYMPYNSKNGRVSNCLIAYNRYVTSGDTVKVGTAGIRFFGTNDGTSIENCTIVANTVEGALSDDSAGIFCTAWHCHFRNNIIVGNTETGKDGRSSVKLESNGGSGYTHYNNITDDVLIENTGMQSRHWLCGASAVRRSRRKFARVRQGYRHWLLRVPERTRIGIYVQVISILVTLR